MVTDTSVKQRCSLPDRVASMLLWLMVGYYGLCSVTIPFINAIWLGELPVLGAIQVPKIALATWFRRGVVMDTIQLLGWSRGSYSRDYLMARPYGLALAYLVSVGIVLAVFWWRNRKRRACLWPAMTLVAAAVVDYAMTLVFGSQRFLTIY